MSFNKPLKIIYFSVYLQSEMITIQGIAKRHSEWLKMAHYLGGDEDAVQEMYLKLLEIETAEGSLKRFEFHNGQVNTMYIFKILQSKVVDEHRRGKKYIDGEQFNPVMPVDNCEIEYQALMDKVKEVIDSMGDYDQMLLELYFVYGFSMREIEKRTGIPLHSIFNRISTAKQIIREKTKDNYYDYCDEKNQTEEVARIGRYHREDNGSDWH